MLGFYVTDSGRDKIANAVQSGTRVAITKCALGDSGDKTGEIDYAKTALTNQVYSKTLDNTDSYTVKGNKVLVKVTVPDSAGELTFNEVGFLDDTDTLIIYGVTGTVHKLPGGDDSPQVVELENYIQLDQKQLDHVEIASGDFGETIDNLSELVENLNGRVSTLEGGEETNLAKRVSALETTLAGMNELLEGIA